MQAKVRSVAFQGVDVLAVDVQVLVAPGQLAFVMVGLADKAVGESRERVRATRRAHDENRDGRRGRTGAATTTRARGTRSSANEGWGGPRDAREGRRAREDATRARSDGDASARDD